MEFIPTSSGRIGYWANGTGPPLVLVHGYTGSSHSFSTVTEDLAANSRVIRMEQAGHGDGDRRATYSVESMAAELAEFVAWLGEPSDVLGHSMGGRIVLEAALAHPGWFRSLILMNTTHGDFGANRPEMERADRLWFADTGEDRRQGVAAGDALYRNSVSAEWLAVDESKGIDPVARQQLGQEIFGGHLEELDVSSIAVPTGIIVGTLDAPYLAPSRAMHEAIDGSRLYLINGAYHQPHLTHRTEWLAAMGDHLSRS